MAYILKWETGEEERSYSTTSYYEFQKQKNKLKEVGVKYREELSGEEKKTVASQNIQKKWEQLNRHKLSEDSKTKIRSFLYTCGKVQRDLKSRTKKS